jgi:hypothetical protein
MTARRGDAFALGALAGELAGAADRLSLLARPAFGRLFVLVVELHLAEETLPLHLLLQRLQRLVDVVVANEYLHSETPCRFVWVQRSCCGAAANSGKIGDPFTRNGGYLSKAKAAQSFAAGRMRLTWPILRPGRASALP